MIDIALLIVVAMIAGGMAGALAGALIVGLARRLDDNVLTDTEFHDDEITYDVPEMIDEDDVINNAVDRRRQEES